jgi:predicted metal-dependent hydrolase
MSPEQAALLASARDLFNAREFFACHDVLEEIWSETLAADRTFYQGLIHAAVALHHFEEHNCGGARKMYFSAVRYLAPYAPVHAGLDVERLLRDMERCFEELLQATPGTIETVRLDIGLIPELRTAAGDEPAGKSS